MLFTILVSALIGAAAMLLIQQWLRDAFRDTEFGDIGARDIGARDIGAPDIEAPDIEAGQVPSTRPQRQLQAVAAGRARLAGSPAGMAPERMRRAG